MGFKNFIREYFTFNRRERNGVFILLSIILVLLLYLSFSDRFFSTEKTDFSRFDKDIAQFEEQLNRSHDSVSPAIKNYFVSSNSPAIDSAARFPFDPNNLPEEDWSRMGLSVKQIKVIKNYESKGGRFRSKEDVKKMYCFSPTLYASLESYIRIPSDSSRKIIKAPLSLWSGAGGEVLVELNSADTIQLDKLKGIGIAFAKRIIKYRDILGGFIRKEQLLEVYGLDKEKYDALSSSVCVDDSKIRKIDINSAVSEELKKHPYIKYNLANLILNYRKQHGNYKSVEDIKQLDLMNDELFTKIAPYLTTQ
jgi:DNA uptake protein ComE-like DNA-binding protein